MADKEKPEESEKQQQERKAILEQIRDMEEYERWQAQLESLRKVKKRRVELFNIALEVISKFKSMSLFGFSVAMGISTKNAGKIAGGAA